MSHAGTHTKRASQIQVLFFQTLPWFRQLLWTSTLCAGDEEECCVLQLCAHLPKCSTLQSDTHHVPNASFLSRQKLLRYVFLLMAYVKSLVPQFDVWWVLKFKARVDLISTHCGLHVIKSSDWFVCNISLQRFSLYKFKLHSVQDSIIHLRHPAGRSLVSVVCDGINRFCSHWSQWQDVF